MRRFFLIPAMLVLLAAELGGASEHPHPLPQVPPFLSADAAWADSVMATLDTGERIAQLMMVAAYSNKGADHVTEMERLISEYQIGGLIFFQGGPVRQAHLTNRYQSIARTPLLVGMDLEWGLAMRLDSTVRFPKQMTLGAIPDEEGIHAMGLEIARQMKRLGVQVSFSPVADVNNDPNNPVINDRSFGEDRDNVTRKAIAYMKGLQQGGVIATAKHFPGHGDTDVDSHKALPVIAHSRTRLDSLELYPFQRLMEEGLSAIMVAHLEVPALENASGVPTTLSRSVVHDLLSDELGFKGLVFTDALNMKGVANADRPGEIELRALQAGNDVLLFPQDPVKAMERIAQAVVDGELDVAEIDRKCFKVLRAKYWAGLSRTRTIPTEGLVDDLNDPAALALRRSLLAQAVTVVRNKDELLPLRRDGERIASVVIGGDEGTDLTYLIDRHARVDHFRCEKETSDQDLSRLMADIEGYGTVLISVVGTSYRVSRSFGVPDRVFEVIRSIDEKHRTVVAFFGNPYRLTDASGMNEVDALVAAYEDAGDVHDVTMQVIFGARPAKGALPVGPSSRIPVGAGIGYGATGILTEGMPEERGLSTADLMMLEPIVREGIREKAYPGCQVLVAHNGMVIWNNAYGGMTYDAERPLRNDDVYDLASITKIAATTLALMALVDEGRLDLDADLGTYLPVLRTRSPGHAQLGIREVLAHQAGLKDWIPFYKKLMQDKKLRPGVVVEKPDPTHTLRVAERVYIDPAYKDSLRQWMLDAPLSAKKEYKYSDLGMLLMQWVVEEVSGSALDAVLEERFYRPLGLSNLGFKPLDRLPKSRIVPTEYDAEFRRQQVHGDVHDPAAAMLGGVAGHAGLFSNAHDLAVLMQLVLNKGSYGGERFLSTAVVDEFTRCQYCIEQGPGAGTKDVNRRGLGFDKPVRDGEGGPTCQCVSLASFGHTGFTGTMAWVDPEEQLIYIFLSNRVYPTALNKGLIQLDIRTRIQEVVHEAVARSAGPR
ncbi:MAG: serine hydrolase [Flavobacteriales bacterium]|nr:serine hydrolase [Flavobacteriales bacterium]